MVSDLDLAELLAAKFCHDIAGPIGAINNGIEFVAEEGFDMKDQAVELIASSAKEASVRLQFFRMAYGSINHAGEANLGQLQKLASAYFASTKITLDWPQTHTDAAEITLNQRMGKLLLNYLIIAASCLPQGGDIQVRLSEENNKRRILVHGTGKQAKVSTDLLSIILDEQVVPEITTRNIQYYLTRRTAQELQGKPQIEHTDSEVTISCLVK